MSETIRLKVTKTKKGFSFVMPQPCDRDVWGGDWCETPNCKCKKPK